MNFTIMVCDYMSIEEKKIELAQCIINARLESGLTQKQLEEKSGVKQPVIARTEKGVSCPNIETLLKLLEPMGKKIIIVDE